MMHHHMTEEDIYRLEGTFAVRKPEGWIIPQWLILARSTIAPLINKGNCSTIEAPTTQELLS